MQEAYKIYRDHPYGLKYHISMVSFYHYISLLNLHYTTTDMPLHCIAYVQKGYMVNNLLTFSINYEDMTNYPSNIFTGCLINYLINRRGFAKFYLKSFVLREYVLYLLSPRIYFSPRWILHRYTYVLHILLCSG